jgi:hypothetical protein
MLKTSALFFICDIFFRPVEKLCTIDTGVSMMYYQKQSKHGLFQAGSI